MEKIIPLLIFVNIIFFVTNNVNTFLLTNLLESFESNITNGFSDILKILRADEIPIMQIINKVPVFPPDRVRTTQEQLKREKDFVILDFIGLVERSGDYTAEEYIVVSDDGYILRLHRVSGSSASPKAVGKPVVYIQHCLFCSSDLFVEYGPRQSLALQLVDNGYDVWIGNIRGNAYSRAHMKDSPEGNNKFFWKFSLDEAALLDIPKFIDFALEKSKQEKLTYIGYSMGTSLGCMLLSGKPEYNKKINLFINLAPAVVFSLPISAVAELLVTTFPSILEKANILEVLPISIAVQEIGKALCVDTPNICTTLLSVVGDNNNIGPKVLPETLGYFPAGISYYILKHFFQLSRANRKLVKFNWDAVGENCTSSVCSDSPYEYNLSLITAPTVIFHAERDALVKTNDVKYLRSQLKNTVYLKKISTFNHMDFITHINAKTTVYDDIIRIMSKYL